MPKVAGFLVAQIVSLGLALAVAYAMSRVPALRPAADVVGVSLSWPVFVAWGLILLFVTPALSRYFSRLFGAKPHEARKAR